MFNKEYILHYKKLLIIAYPIVFGQLGHMMTQIADAVMVGQVGSEQLAASSVANSLFFIFFVMAIGFSGGVSPLVGKAFGANDKDRINRILINSLMIHFFVGIVITIIPQFFTQAFVWLGQPEEIIGLAKSYFLILCFSMFPYMIFMNYKMFAEGLAITFPAMVISLALNLLNIFLNWIFIFGNLGFESMGLDGAGYATLISRIGMAISMAAFVHLSIRIKPYIKTMKLKFDKEIVQKLFKLGMPIATQYLMEVGVFAGGTFMVGWFGSTYLAAHHISINIAATTFMMAGGISAAATVRVSYFIGRQRFGQMKKAAYSSFNLVLTFMTLTSISIIILRYWLPTLFIDEAEVIEATAQLLLIASLFQLFDGIQVNALGILRGMQDVNIPTGINFINYWVITFPMCYVYSVVLGYGAYGVWLGYLTGLFLASITLFARFYLIRDSIRYKFSS